MYNVLYCPIAHSKILKQKSFFLNYDKDATIFQKVACIYLDLFLRNNFLSL